MHLVQNKSPQQFPSLSDTLAQEEERGHKTEWWRELGIFQHHDFWILFGRLLHRFVEIIAGYCTVFNVSVLCIFVYYGGKKRCCFWLFAIVDVERSRMFHVKAIVCWWLLCIEKGDLRQTKTHQLLQHGQVPRKRPRPFDCLPYQLPAPSLSSPELTWYTRHLRWEHGMA